MNVRKASAFLLLSAILILSYICIASGVGNAEKLPNEVRIDKLKTELIITKQALEEVRRDQLNYQIEKDLLKEAYSSNIQTLNIVITIALGVFTIIGFLIGILGIKSILAIKKDFQNELDNLMKIRDKYEDKFIEIGKALEGSKKQYKELQDSSQKQDKRLQLLEIQEKASACYKDKSYKRALEYLKIGLELEPNNLFMLHGHANCYMHLFRLEKAIKIYKLIIEQTPDDIITIINLAEAYLLTKSIENYEKIIENYIDEIEEKYPIFLFIYFDILKAYINSDNNTMANIIKKIMSEAPSGKEERIIPWAFAGVKRFIKGDEDTKLKLQMLKCIEFFEGKIDTSELESIL